MRHKLRNNNHITNATKTSFTSVKGAIFMQKKGGKTMKRKLITATLFIASIVGAFLIGKSQAKTIEPSIENYIECETFETYYIDGNELHIIANHGNEYVFTK